MSDVVKFPTRKGDAVNPTVAPAEQLIWLCTCGCQSFELYSDGRTECCHCGTISNGPDGNWHKLKPAPDPEVAAPFPDAGTVNVTRIHNTGSAMKSVLDGADEDHTAFVLVVDKDGHTSSWKHREFDDGDAVWWLDDMLRGARKLLLPIGTPENSLDHLRACITNSDELAAVVVIRQDGDVSTWNSSKAPLETPADAEWLDRKLALGRKLLLTPLDVDTSDMFAEPAGTHPDTQV